MSHQFLLYGATGFVGAAIAELAVKMGLSPILAGRDPNKLSSLAEELALEYRPFSLDDPVAVDAALEGMGAVLNCAGPFIYTFGPMVDACIRRGIHYADITGELPVFAAIAERDKEAKERGVMLLPGAGFDVLPTDCLAVHLKQRLPSATTLTLAFMGRGPSGLPPGTQRTAIELVPYGNRIRKDGRLEAPKRGIKTRQVDFGYGPVETTRVTWGDVFTAFYSTGIGNIEVYAGFPKSVQRQIAMFEYIGPLLKWRPVREFMKRGVRPGPTAGKRALAKTLVWGEVKNEEGESVVARLKGPEAGVEWTALAALSVVRRVLGGDAPPGYQTPGKAYGADFVLESEGVVREEVS